MILGALEAGGTKMVCAVGNEKGEIFEQISIPTRTPETTVPEMISYFKEKKVEALGIGCFGPIDPDRNSKTYGYITSTPKLAWADYNIVGAFEEALGCPVGFDTDVNGSVLGEVTFGQAKGKSCVIYITIGTGVGAGIYIEGKLLHGMLHPEAGHVLIQKRSSEVWKVLGAVKTEFEKFGGMLEKAQKNIQTANNQIEEVMGKRTRAIQRRLRDIEALPSAEAALLIPEAEEADDLSPEN